MQECGEMTMDERLLSENPGPHPWQGTFPRIPIPQAGSGWLIFVRSFYFTPALPLCMQPFFSGKGKRASRNLAVSWRRMENSWWPGRSSAGVSRIPWRFMEGLWRPVSRRL